MTNYIIFFSPVVKCDEYEYAQTFPTQFIQSNLLQAKLYKWSVARLPASVVSQPLQELAKIGTQHQQRYNLVQYDSCGLFKNFNTLNFLQKKGFTLTDELDTSENFKVKITPIKKVYKTCLSDQVKAVESVKMMKLYRKRKILLLVQKQ